MGTLPSNLIDDAVTAVANGINTGIDVFADGFQFPDVFAFIPTALSIQAIVEKKDELLAQIKDYDLNERATTIETIKSTLNLTNEDAEELVGIAYDIVFGFVRGAIWLSNKNKATDEG